MHSVSQFKMEDYVSLFSKFYLEGYKEIKQGITIARMGAVDLTHPWNRVISEFLRLEHHLR